MVHLLIIIDRLRQIEPHRGTNMVGKPLSPHWLSRMSLHGRNNGFPLMGLCNMKETDVPGVYSQKASVFRNNHIQHPNYTGCHLELFFILRGCSSCFAPSIQVLTVHHLKFPVGFSFLFSVSLLFSLIFSRNVFNQIISNLWTKR